MACPPHVLLIIAAIIMYPALGLSRVMSSDIPLTIGAAISVIILMILFSKLVVDMSNRRETGKVMKKMKDRNEKDAGIEEEGKCKCPCSWMGAFFPTRK